MTRKRRRLMIVALCGLGLGAAAALTLTAFEDNILFFYSPSDIADRQVSPGQRFRLGGLVAEGSVARLAGTAEVEFTVTDLAHDVSVRYGGILPDLFREGQGVVAHGTLDPGGLFVADEVLARHDETYMPPEVAAALEAAGHGPLTGPAASGNPAAGPRRDTGTVATQ